MEWKGKERMGQEWIGKEWNGVHVKEMTGKARKAEEGD